MADPLRIWTSLASMSGGAGSLVAPAFRRCPASAPAGRRCHEIPRKVGVIRVHPFRRSRDPDRIIPCFPMGSRGRADARPRPGQGSPASEARGHPERPWAPAPGPREWRDGPGRIADPTAGGRPRDARSAPGAHPSILTGSPLVLTDMILTSMTSGSTGGMATSSWSVRDGEPAGAGPHGRWRGRGAGPESGSAGRAAPAQAATRSATSVSRVGSSIASVVKTWRRPAGRLRRAGMGTVSGCGAQGTGAGMPSTSMAQLFIIRYRATDGKSVPF